MFYQEGWRILCHWFECSHLGLARPCDHTVTQKPARRKTAGAVLPLPGASLNAISNKEKHLQRLILQTSQEFHLTHREQEVLRLLIMGLTNKEIAARMGISANTVKGFVHLVMLKMGTSGRSGIVAKVLLRALSLPPKVINPNESEHSG